MLTKPVEARAYQLFHEGSIAMAHMEAAGIRIDENYLNTSIDRIGTRIKAIEEELKADKIYSLWRREYGANAKLSSPEHLGHILFDILKYPCKYWTSGGKTGKRRPSTAEEHLKELDNPFVQTWLKRNGLVKLKNTFLGGLRRETVAGFFHPNFNLHTVRTYRSSSGSDKSEGSTRDLNFQNLPIRDPNHGRYIRRCFIPRDGQVLIEIDYSALEFKIASAFWKDPEMIAYASDPDKDIHKDMAAMIFMCDREQVSKGMRYLAKNGFVFPVLYGSYYVKCAMGIWGELSELKLKDGVTSVIDHLASKEVTTLGSCDSQVPPKPGTFEHRIKVIEDWFFTKFHVMRENKSKWLAAYKRKGGFPLMTGFWVEGIFSNNQLLNTPVQGPGFHCLLWSLIEVDKWLRKYKMTTLSVGQIHDCGLLDSPVNELQDVLHNVNRIMTVEIRKAWDWIVVPLATEVDVVDIGQSWYDKAVWVEKEGSWGPKVKAA